MLSNSLITEELTRTLISNLPGGAAFVVDRNFRYLLAEGEALAIAGFKPEDFVGRTIFEALPPELVPHHESLYRRGLAGETFEHEHNAHNRTYISRGTPLRSENGEVYAVLAVSYDITDRKRVEDDRKRAEQTLRESETRQAFLLQMSNALRAEPDADSVASRAVRMLAEHLRLDRVWLSEVFEQQGISTVGPEYHRPDLPPMSGIYRLSDYPETMRQLATQPMVIHDVANDSGFSDSEKVLLDQLHLRSLLVVALRKGQHQVIWAMAVAMTTPRHWNESERVLLEEVVEHVWAAVERARAEAALRESEAKYRSLFDSIDEGYLLCEVIFDENNQPIDILYLEANPAAVRLAGRDFTGQRMREIDPNYEDYWYEIIGRVALTGESVHAERYAEPHGRWFDFRASRVGGQESRCVASIFQDTTERKRQETNLSFLAEISQDLARLTNIDETMNVLGEKIGRYFNVSACVFAELSETAEIAVINYTWQLSHMPSFIGTYRMQDFVTPEVLQLCLAGEAVVIRDVFNDPLVDGEQYAALNIGSFLSIPLIRDSEWRFLLVIYHSEPHDWRDDEIELTHELANRIWTRLERARAEEQLRRAAEMDAFRVKLSDALRSLSNAVEIQATVTRTTMNFFKADRCYYCEIIDGSAIIRRDASQAELPSVVGVYPLENSPIFKAMLDAGQPFVFQDVHTTNVLDENLRQLCLQLQIIAGMNVPVIKQGEPVGILCLTQSTPRNWTQFEMDLAEEIADRTWATIERARAEAALEEDLKNTQVLHNLATRLVIEEDRQALYQEIVKTAIALTQADAGSFQVLDETTQELVIMATQGIDRTMVEHFYRLDASSNTSCGIALTTGERTFIHFDVPESEDPDGSLRIHREAGFCCVQSTPLRSRSGKPIGMFSTHWREDHQLSDRELRFLDLLARQAADIIEQRQAEENRIQLIQEQSAREQERQRAESLAELDRAKTRFFSNISHEFRTPLTLSLAPLQEVLSDCALPSIYRERLELVHRNSLRLLKLVNTLLDFSRIEAGRIEAVYEPTDLATYTAELASVFRSAIEQAGLELIIDCSPLPEPVYVDREMWEKIVLNLLSNAFKFTFEGDITVSLKAEPCSNLQASTSEPQSSTSEPQSSTSELEALTSELEPRSSDPETTPSEHQSPTSELEASTSELNTLTSELEPPGSELQTPTSHLHAILEICDTGTGIAPEHLPHLFERFYQVRGSQARTQQGSGIGLALVHELVQLQGGSVAVSSTSSKGTCFRVCLPFGTDHLPSDRLQNQGDSVQPTRTLASTTMGSIDYVEEAERWLPIEENQEQTTPADASLPAIASACVLLVDDNADMREYLTRILSEHVHVKAVADGATALGVAQEQVPDLILSDVMMPGLNGFELLHELRSHPRTKEVPIILLSARAGEEAIVEGLAAGADDYLIKPFSAQELVSRVTTHLQIAQQRREALQQEQLMNRRKDELMSVVSHELNSPLVAILGWTRLLRTNSADPALLSKALDTIERNATLQAKLVQDLLDISRITAGKLRLNSQPIELQSMIETAIATVTQTAASKKIHLTWQDTTTEPVVVIGDGDRLAQVLINLLTNAIKFTPEAGSVTLELAVHSVANADSTDAFYAEMRVIDTGIGIAADFLPYVFDRFRQADNANAGKGLGLGLTIARQIVELHHGTIHAESAGAGQGAIFAVRLPLVQSK